MIDGNYLYFESNCREAMRNINLGDTAICDVYRLDLDNIEEGAKLIAEGVHNFTHTMVIYTILSGTTKITVN